MKSDSNGQPELYFELEIQLYSIEGNHEEIRKWTEELASTQDEMLETQDELVKGQKAMSTMMEQLWAFMQKSIKNYIWLMQAAQTQR
jgi:tRNA G37 N-methylase TrmD